VFVQGFTRLLRSVKKSDSEFCCSEKAGQRGVTRFYIFSRAVAADLRDIGRYSVKQWARINTVFAVKVTLTKAVRIALVP
jgi:hypothetical protein